MVWKLVKYGTLGLGGAVVLGGLVFGTEIFSYVGSSARTMQAAMKDSVPIEFELKRAQDLLEQILPEMQANVRLIAQEEVEVANLEGEIKACQGALQEQKVRVARLRDLLTGEQTRLVVGGLEYSRQQVKEELARRFNQLQEAEMVLSGKQRLLENRQRALYAAMQMLEKTKAQKVRLQDQIASLESQHRLVQAASVGSKFQLDNSKLAQTEKLLGEIKKRLDVAERVLAHEARFTDALPVDVVDERDLVAEVNEYLSPGQETPDRVALNREAN